ncbi:hypothetical protein DOTSEDRAFT_64527 [Dothistroma septosporum NZE10]|uniref:Sugar phosphate transporter domain-containing protein n=1 Tax=Dothistroma septosporum (strain NZE10 / CBS 128990) TaxID=675120 RepID=N1PHW2_DOTSN|nr:hypothetical protein DOTSEDRAFT_64527 [Dothistroma septosporum NZE10]
MSQHNSVGDKSHDIINTTLKLESQSSANAPHEYNVSGTRKIVALGLYFLLALSLTLSNKVVLQSAPYPWLLTATHATTTTVGCLILHYMGYFRWTRLRARDNLALVAFSCLFTANIATSNLSLGLVSVPFHQVLRSTVPVVTILLYRWVYGRSYSRQTYWTMVPLIGGVGLATFGDYFFTMKGFLLTSFGVFLAAIKSVASNRLMTGSLSLSALEILFRMSPLAAMQSFVCALASGEVHTVQRTFASGQVFTSRYMTVLACNALMAFMLNGMSFYANKVTGALTVSVCANLSQVLTILTSIVLFSVPVSPLHGVGMVIALIGAAWYTKAELDAQREREQIAVKE